MLKVGNWGDDCLVKSGMIQGDVEVMLIDPTLSCKYNRGRQKLMPVCNGISFRNQELGCKRVHAERCWLVLRFIKAELPNCQAPLVIGILSAGEGEW